MESQIAGHYIYSARKTHYLPEILQRFVFICLVILFGIAAFFPAPAAGAVLLDRVVATVNDEVITWSELMNVIHVEGKTFLEGVPDNLKKQRIKELEKPFLNNLVEMKLQIQEAFRMGLNVSNEELDGAVADIKGKYSMTDEVFMNSLATEGMTMLDYRKRLSDQILLQKVVNYAVRNNIVISDREIEDYYEANSDDFSGKEKISVRQIFFTKPEGSSGREAVEEKARGISQRLAAGEDFAKLASEFSDGPSRQYGGDLGFISRGTVLKEVEDVAFALKIDEVSNPFWSQGGLHIIKVEDRIESGTLEQVRDKVRDIIYQQVFKSQYNEWRTGLRENAYVDKKR